MTPAPPPSPPRRPPPGTRARNRAATEAEIVRVGRQHLTEVGAAALSLRAVARDLGMVSSAIYRYVANRDELLTILIVAAYDSLGDHVDAALETASDTAAGSGTVASPRVQFITICHGVRSWALANPQDYALVYGSPVPQYHAPEERTTASGTRVTQHLVDLLGPTDPGAQTGDPDAVAAGGHALEHVAQDPFFAGRQVHPVALLRGLAGWSLVLGALSAEVFEQYGPGLVADPDAHFVAMIALAADVVLGP